MADATPLLQTSMAEVAYRVTWDQFNRWVRTGRRLVRRRGLESLPDEAEALHDYRVALRRLRSLLQAFRPWLARVPRGSRRRLRSLMRATNESRNIEVLLAWADAQTATLTPRHQSGAVWFAAQLRRRRAYADDLMLNRIAKRSSPLRADLRKALGPSAVLRPPAHPLPAGYALRQLIRRETAALEHALTAVRTMADRQEIHLARIAAKRVRYLLEPFASELPEDSDILTRLRELQERLGAVTDAHGAADELRLALVEASADRAHGLSRDLLPWPGTDPSAPSVPPSPPGARSGLAALARRLRREGDSAFEQLREEWLEGPKQELFVLLRKLAGEMPVRRSGRPDSNRRLPAPK